MGLCYLRQMYGMRRCNCVSTTRS